MKIKEEQSRALKQRLWMARVQGIADDLMAWVKLWRDRHEVKAKVDAPDFTKSQTSGNYDLCSHFYWQLEVSPLKGEPMFLIEITGTGAEKDKATIAATLYVESDRDLLVDALKDLTEFLPDSFNEEIKLIHDWRIPLEAGI